MGPSLRWNEHIEGDGATIFRQACIAGSRRHRYRIRSKAASPLWSHGTASPSSGQRKASVNPPATRALRDALFYRWRRLDGGCPPAIGAAGPLGALPAPRGHIRGQDSGGSGGSGIGRVTSALKALQAAPVLAASPSPHRHTSALVALPSLYQRNDLASEHLWFPKIRSGRIRAVRQNQRIIRCDVCDRPPTWNVCCQPVQVAAPA